MRILARAGFLWGSFLAMTLLSSLPALADGKIFSSRALPVQVEVPDQRAMLYFSNGLERLVIETSFIAPGTNFAWVVPLPSVPRIEPVSPNFFRALEVAFQPKVIFRVSNGWIFFLVVGAVIATGVHLRRTNQRLAGCFVLAVLLLLLAALALPSFVKARGSVSAQHGSVQVIERERVGVYDTAVLSGRDGGELLNWLNMNGFYTPTNVLPVISSYATQGWVFAAATINRSSKAEEGSRPHPLAFTFSTKQAVYPLRLTGVENDKCSIELFVFGPERAEAAGFEVEHCGPPSRGKEVAVENLSENRELFVLPRPGEYRVRAPEVQALAMPSVVATKLVGTLSGAQMRSDAWIRWVPFRPSLPVLHSPEAAVDATMNWLVGLAVLGGLAIQGLAPRLTSKQLRQALLAVLGVAVLCGGIRWATAKTVEVRMVRGGAMYTIYRWRQLDCEIQRFALERTNSAAPTFDELKTALKSYHPGAQEPLNTFTEEPLRNEASPGNLTLRPAADAVEVIWHDIEGIGHVMVTVTNRGK